MRIQARICGCIPPSFPWGTRPTYAGGRVYVGGLDRKIHAIDADTGQGLWTFSAAGGFHTSPLVVGGLVYAGSRDGCMYAVDANSGELVWKHQTGGQILQSAAYQDGVIFFGSQDARAYALDARTGTQVWQSDKLPGMGWHSWWPVIYKDVVLFTRTEVEKGLVGFQNEWVFSKNKTAKNLPGVRGTEPGDWAAGEPTVDIRTNPNGGTIPDWFEQYPWRRSLIVLDRRTGKEVAFDLDNDGLTDAAPMLWGVDAWRDVLSPVGQRPRWGDLLSQCESRHGRRDPGSGDGRLEVWHAFPEPAGLEHVGAERLLARR